MSSGDADSATPQFLYSHKESSAPYFDTTLQTPPTIVPPTDIEHNDQLHPTRIVTLTPPITSESETSLSSLSLNHNQVNNDSPRFTNVVTVSSFLPTTGFDSSGSHSLFSPYFESESFATPLTPSTQSKDRFIPTHATSNLLSFNTDQDMLNRSPFLQNTLALPTDSPDQISTKNDTFSISYGHSSIFPSLSDHDSLFGSNSGHLDNTSDYETFTDPPSHHVSDFVFKTPLSGYIPAEMDYGPDFQISSPSSLDPSPQFIEVSPSQHLSHSGMMNFGSADLSLHSISHDFDPHLQLSNFLTPQNAPLSPQLLYLPDGDQTPPLSTTLSSMATASPQNSSHTIFQQSSHPTKMFFGPLLTHFQPIGTITNEQEHTKPQIGPGSVVLPPSRQPSQLSVHSPSTVPTRSLHAFHTSIPDQPTQLHTNVQFLQHRISQDIAAVAELKINAKTQTTPEMEQLMARLLSNVTHLARVPPDTHIVTLLTTVTDANILQQAVHRAPAEVILKLTMALKPHFLVIITDWSGSSIIQTLIERERSVRENSQSKLNSPLLNISEIILDSLHTSFSTLACGRNSCRALQLLMGVVPHPITKRYAPSIENKLSHTMRDINGNHCIQTIIRNTPPIHRDWMVDALLRIDMRSKTKSEGSQNGTTLAELCCHIYACRVVQTLVNDSTDDQKHKLFLLLADSAPQLSGDSYGNYIMQKMLEFNEASIVQKVCRLVVPHIRSLCLSKFGSNVAEKVVKRIDRSWLPDTVLSLFGLNDHAVRLRNEAGLEESRGLLHEEKIISLASLVSHDMAMSVLTDQFGNYVVQRVLERADGFVLQFVLVVVEGLWAQLSRNPHGKHVIQTVERIRRKEQAGGVRSGKGMGSTGKSENGIGGRGSGLMRETHQPFPQLHAPLQITFTPSHLTPHNQHNTILPFSSPFTPNSLIPAPVPLATQHDIVSQSFPLPASPKHQNVFRGGG